MNRPEIQPGRLLERQASDSEMDRTVFGEFVSPRGELASYAFGWSTGAPEVSGRLTVGIGAGNVGGGSFHIRVFEHDGGYAMALVDDPFERVPQGGPDLSRAEGLAHEDLPFIWFVADEVMRQDPRAWWMQHWLLRTSVVATPVVLERRGPVLRLVHDEDGIWQAIGGADAGNDGGALHLWHLVDEDRSLLPVLDLDVGHAARRRSPSSTWEREPVAAVRTASKRRRLFRSKK